MYDVALFYREQAKRESKILKELDLAERGYALATCHRAENTDDLDRLNGIASALGKIAEDIPVVLPLHPRTRKLLVDHGLEGKLGRTKVTEPLPFLDMIALEQAAKVILTDSGGVQKEAFFYGVPCITMRDETEWVETVHTGANQLAGASVPSILAAYANVAASANPVTTPMPYGDGNAAKNIVEIIQIRS